MRTKLLWATTGVLSLVVLLLTAMIVTIRSGLQRYSDEAVSRFPGDRISALIKMADCHSCPIRDRNHAVWALGQMAAGRARPALLKYVDGRPCDHETRLCQKELHKAIRAIEFAQEHTGFPWRLVAGWHQPWR